MVLQEWITVHCGAVQLPGFIWHLECHLSRGTFGTRRASASNGQQCGCTSGSDCHSGCDGVWKAPVETEHGGWDVGFVTTAANACG
jgi:hypothetical protein